MVIISVWKSFDGKFFEKQEECEEYEKNHTLLNPKQILFYNNDGKIVDTPDDHVFLDSNAFKVFTEKALVCYCEYCKNLKIRVPENYSDLSFPRHYKFDKGTWICIEWEIKQLNDTLKNFFKEVYVEEEEERHDLPGGYCEY